MEALSIIQPKRPAGPGWTRVPCHDSYGYPMEAWRHDASGLFVLSAVEVVPPEPGEPDIGPEYHVSVTQRRERCSSADAVWVLAQFGLVDALEDNHVPHGKARNFWRPVADKWAGMQCPCVADEPAIVEDKGDYTWRGVTR